MSEKIASFYKAKDDTEFPTKAEAAEHNRLVDAKRELQDAVENVSRVMKEQALTADGEPFAKSGRYSDFWRLMPWSNGLPQLVRFYCIPYHVQCDLDYAKGRLVVREYNDGRYVSVPVDELYVSKRKAQEAHLKLCEERMVEYREQIDELKRSYAANA